MKINPDISVLRNELTITPNYRPKSSDMTLELIRNEVTLMRSDIFRTLIDPKRDLFKECGYPVQILLKHYMDIWERDGIGSRFINIWPDECWGSPPEIIEGEQNADTEFELAIKQLNEDHQLFNLLHTADQISGVGQFGIILLGINDGRDLSQPVQGVTGMPLHDREGPGVTRKLLYARTFGQSNVNILSVEKDIKSPRFGLPLEYELQWQDNILGNATQMPTIARKVHWSRVIHLADRRISSPTWGVPRLQRIFNYVFNMQKVLGGSSEMFWKGGFPGFAFELNPDIKGDVSFDPEQFREQLEAWSSGMQRYLTLLNMSAKTLAVSIADPTPHQLIQINAMCTAEGVPMRVLMGTEEGKLAGAQDERGWDKKVKGRQTRYVVPNVIKPTVNRLLECGILPWVDKYTAQFPDVSAPSDSDKAEVAAKETTALSAYVSGGVEAVIPPKEYMLHVLKWDEKKVNAIDAATKKFIDSSTMDRMQEIKNPAPKIPLGPDGKPAPKPAPVLRGGMNGTKRPSQTSARRSQRSGPPSKLRR